MDREPFAPLANDELGCGTNAAAESTHADGELEPALPPAGSAPPDHHPELGRWSWRWPYHAGDGALEGYVCRFETPTGKEFRPLRHGRLGGRVGWHWKGWGGRRPAYRLREALDAPALPVLVVEGEKTADAAAALLPGYAVVTAMGGAGSPGKTDWGFLAGRNVAIWPDHDAPGRAFAREVAELARQAGAASVRILAVPPGAPAGWDLADAPPEAWGEGTIAAALLEAEEEVQGAFRVVHRPGDAGSIPGLYRLRTSEVDGKIVEEWVRFGSPLEVQADSRTTRSEDWGRLLVVRDRDGVVHPWAMPMALLAGDGADVRRELLRLGFEPAAGPKPRLWLQEFLTAWRPQGKVRCVDRIGWHGDGVFVLPDRTLGDAAGERVVLQLAGAAPQLDVAGSLEGWQAEVAAVAAGNSRLVLAVSTAFAGPLAHLAGEESGGFHFTGASSIGKTVALHAARSVWGAPLGNWRTTDNGAEGLARGACDTLLVLDEIGQASPPVVEALAYLLGNQRGKARMRRDATASPCATWRVLFLSTGETGLAARLAEGGKRAMAGQLVRVIEIPADGGAGLGLFEELHDFADGAELAEHQRLAADRQCGHAGRAFLERLLPRAGHWAGVVRQARQRFLAENCPAGADGQVKRACGRFALVAAAGELATALGVVPWDAGAAERATVRCFDDWLRRRGGAGAAEVVAGLRQVRLFIEQHGSSRFEAAWSPGNGSLAGDARTVNRAGFRKADDQGNWTYYVLPECWAAEVCKGMDPGRVARVMAERGWLERGDGRNLARKVRVPGFGEARLYVVRASFLAGEEDSDADR